MLEDEFLVIPIYPLSTLQFTSIVGFNPPSVVVLKSIVFFLINFPFIFSKTTTYPATVMADSNCAVGYLNKAELIKLFSLNDTILENFMMLLSDKVVMLNNKIKSISYSLHSSHSCKRTFKEF